MNLLIEALDTECVSTKIWAVKAIAGLGSSARAASHAIKRLRKHPNPSLREAVARALEQIGEPVGAQAREFVPHASIQFLPN